MSAPGDQAALTRGALVLSSAAGVRRAIAFQVNPETVHRTIEPNTVGGRQGSRSEAVRFAGAPSETLTLECRLSATEGEGGIEPQLAALALLAYPTTASVRDAQALLDDGTIEVLPALADQLLFVWGPRVLPVRLDGCTIVEELYDSDLRPVLATVTLTLRALSYSDVDAANPASGQFLTYQGGLERTAAAAYSPWSAPDGTGG